MYAKRVLLIALLALAVVAAPLGVKTVAASGESGPTLPCNNC